MSLRAQLLADHEAFLRDYRSRFQGVFVKVGRVLDRQWSDEEALRLASLAFYDRYFLMEEAPEGEVAAAEVAAPLLILAEEGLDVAPILAKCFAVMTAEFVHHVVKSGVVVEPVHTLTEVMGEAQGLFEEVTAVEHHTRDESAVVRMAMEHEGEEVALEVTCSGVQISQQGTLQRAEPGEGTLELRLPESHRLVIESGQRVSMKAAFLPRTLIGRSVSLDEESRALLLDEIIEAEHADRPRGAVRVQPHGLIEVSIAGQEGNYAGRLVDISVGGASVEAKEELPLARGTWVHLRFELPSLGRAGSSMVDVRAEVAGAFGGQGGGAGAWRYGLRLMPNLHEEKAIAEYVNHLQSEVIRQIQPEIKRSLYSGEKRAWRMPTALVVLILANFILLFGAIAWVLAEKRGDTPLGIDRIAEMLAAQEECDTLSERYARTGNRNDLARFEACERRLEQARGETRWRR